MITLTNKTRRRLEIPLVGEEFRRGAWGFRWLRLELSEHDGKTGEVTLRERRFAVPGGLTLLPGERRAGLPDAVARLPRVRELEARGEVIVERAPEAAPAASPKDAAPAAPASGEKKGKRSKGRVE